MTTRIAILLLATVLLAGCRTGRNYPDTGGPRHGGRPAAEGNVRPARGDTVHVVSFNIAFGRRADSAIKLLKTDPALRDADVVLLQEMDAPSTQRVANALGFWYVYYPAICSLRTKRDFGNAVLSRVADRARASYNARRPLGSHFLQRPHNAGCGRRNSS